MAVISVNPENIKNASMRERDLSYLLKQLAAETRSVRMSMDYEIRAKEQISRKLSKVEEAISSEADILRARSEDLETIANQYLRTERENVSRLHADAADVRSTSSIIAGMISVVIRPWILIPPGPRPAPFIPRPLPWPYFVTPTPRPFPPRIPSKPHIWGKGDWAWIVQPPKAIFYTLTGRTRFKKFGGEDAWRPGRIKPLAIQSALSILGNAGRTQ